MTPDDRRTTDGLDDAEPTSKEVRAQVTDVDMAMQLMLPDRLHDLPAEVLARIARITGLSTRQDSQLWKDIYGPLDCPLTIPDIHTKAHLESLLTPNPRRFHSIPSLTLPATLPASESADYSTSYPATFLEALRSAFPSLQSLSFSSNRQATAADLSHLSPLATSLTALHLPCISAPVAATTSASSLLPFIRLRSLSLDISLLADPPAITLTQFSRLPHLQYLEWRNSQEPLPAAEWIPFLSTLHLTSLVIEPCLFQLRCLGPGRTSHRLFRHVRTLPQRQKSTQAPRVPPSSCPHGMADVVAALGRRTALRSLQLNTCRFDGRDSLDALSNLQLSSFTAAVRDGDVLTSMLKSLAHMTTLTALRLFAPASPGSYRPFVDVYSATYSVLASVTSTMDSLHLSGIRIDPEDSVEAGLFQLIRYWGGLTELRLGAISRSGFGSEMEATCGWSSELSELSDLTKLQVLAVLCDGRKFRGTVKPSLRELALAEEEAEEGSEDEEEEEDDAGEDEDQEEDEGTKHGDPLLRLHKLSTSLTRLVLGSCEASRSGSIKAPGLAVVASLTRLQQAAAEAVEPAGAGWAGLAQAPAAAPLQLAQAGGGGRGAAPPDPRRALQDAADMQGFAFRVG